MFSLQMLNIMKGMKESESGRDKGEGEVSLRPSNLSTMLSSQPRSRSPSADLHHAANNSGNKRHSESSLSPRSPRPHHRDLEEDIVADSSGGGPPSAPRGRHSSGGSVEAAELRAQFLNDLRRLGAGANIPTQSSAAGNGEHQAASSTTHSPPPLTGIPHGPRTPTESGSGSGSLQTSPTKSADDNLPPRKRKVSQEHHQPQRSPYNGILDKEAVERGGGGSESGAKVPGDEPSPSVQDVRN